ncbi:MAG: folylpolyglutamate synthase/dihydrofolate synthase family protein [Gemmatimonadota bacterium]
MLSRRPASGGAFATLLALSPPTRIVWGLDRIRAILSELGEPQASFRSVLIAGTNGKGSVAATVESLFRARGHRTGLYTSPHLVDPAERVRVGGLPAGRALLESAAADVLPLARREGATFFEAVTAVGFLAFARAGVDVAAVEVGLGGRLDATNVLDPLACVITNVDLDHADYLGGTLEAIAAEKSGILKPGVPAVVGPIPDSPLEVVAERARRVGAPLLVLGHGPVVVAVSADRKGTRFVFRSERFPAGRAFRTPLVGGHQAINAGLALAAIELCGLAVDDERTDRGLAEIRWPGRFDVRERPDGIWVFDVAHNPAGARALAATLAQVPLPRPRACLVGILGDKPWREMLDPVLRGTSAAVFTTPPSAPASRRWDPVAARATVPGHRVEVEPDFPAALRRVRELAAAGTVVVTGSSHTVGDALRLLEGDPEPDQER